MARRMSNPEQLIDEFKKSGEFDRLRRELLAEFQRSERIVGFQSRVDDIARQRLASDANLINQPHDAVYRELMGEIDRYPILERAVAEAPLLSDAAYAESIRASLERILGSSENHGENASHAGSADSNRLENTALPESTGHVQLAS